MTQETLKRRLDKFSEAASEGPWTWEVDQDNFRCCIYSGDPLGHLVTEVGNAENDWTRDEADTALISELVNAYRSGQLVTLDDPRASSGVAAIASERQRQVEVEGWTPERDAMHGFGELAGAAACYAMQAAIDGIGRPDLRSMVKHTIRELWPWSSHWWKPKAARADLVRAGALIAAEIDRLDRAASQEDPQ